MAGEACEWDGRTASESLVWVTREELSDRATAARLLGRVSARSWGDG